MGHSLTAAADGIGEGSAGVEDVLQAAPKPGNTQRTDRRIRAIDTAGPTPPGVLRGRRAGKCAPVDIDNGSAEGV
jgi:hypothetical protein